MTEYAAAQADHVAAGPTDAEQRAERDLRLRRQAQRGRLALILRGRAATDPGLTDVFELGPDRDGGLLVVDLRTGESITRPDLKWGRAVQDLRARLGLAHAQVLVRNFRPEVLK